MGFRDRGIQRKGEAEVTVPEWPSLKKWLQSLFCLVVGVLLLNEARAAEGFHLIMSLVGASSTIAGGFFFARDALQER